VLGREPLYSGSGHGTWLDGRVCCIAYLLCTKYQSILLSPRQHHALRDCSLTSSEDIVNEGPAHEGPSAPGPATTRHAPPCGLATYREPDGTHRCDVGYASALALALDLCWRRLVSVSSFERAHARTSGIRSASLTTAHTTSPRTAGTARTTADGFRNGGDDRPCVVRASWWPA
jgi:hypothetical protein